MDELCFFFSRVISPMLSYAAKLELCFRGQRKAKVDVEIIQCKIRTFT